MAKNTHKLLICIDIGNTRTDIALFRKRTLISKYSVYKNEIPKVINKLTKSGLKSSYISVICSVVPQITNKVILQLKKSHIQSYRISQISSSLGRRSLVKGSYKKLGEDRQVALWVALQYYKAPVIVIDLGTAVTIDAATRDGRYAGGIILPGLNMWRKSLATGTALLPEVTYRTKGPLLGRSTRECIQSGLRHGMAGMLNDLLSDIKAHIGPRTRVVLTGGNALDVARRLRHDTVVDDMLILRGLNELIAGREGA